jgi:hypothetical protein
MELIPSRLRKQSDWRCNARSDSTTVDIENLVVIADFIWQKEYFSITIIKGYILQQ